MYARSCHGQSDQLSPVRYPTIADTVGPLTRGGSIHVTSPIVSAHARDILKQYLPQWYM